MPEEKTKAKSQTKKKSQNRKKNQEREMKVAEKDLAEVVAVAAQAMLHIKKAESNASATKKGKSKGKKKPRIKLTDREKEEVERIKTEGKAANKKFYERQREIRKYIQGIKAARRAADMEDMRQGENDVRDAERDYQREVARARGIDPGEDVYYTEGKIRQPSFGGALSGRGMLSRWG